MFGQKHPIRLNKRFVSTSNYQLGVNYETFLDFISDVKVIKFVSDGFRQGPDVFVPGLINTLQRGETEVFGGTALIQRSMEPSGTLDINEEEQIPHSITFADSFYPLFVGGASQSRLVIDFGRTSPLNTRLYPFLNARVGPTFLSGGNTVGAIQIERIGSLPLYSTDSTSTVVAGGVATIEERYSSLQPNTKVVPRNGAIRFDTNGKFSFLETYVPYIKGVKMSFTVTSRTINVFLPSWLKGSFRVSFVSETYQDRFKSPLIRTS